MDYNSLTSAYLAAQRARVEELRAQIASKATCVTSGRVIPDHADQVLGDARRLKMAILFLDICGFSSRPAETEKEQDMLVRVLHLFFTEMVRIAEEYGGTVEKNTGDGLTRSNLSELAHAKARSVRSEKIAAPVPGT